MNYLKAAFGGIAGSTLAPVLVWLLGAVALTIRFNRLSAQGMGIEGLSLPVWTAWFILPIPVLAAVGGFWAGFRFTMWLQSDLERLTVSK
jgi:hypothetical protein